MSATRSTKTGHEGFVRRLYASRTIAGLRLAEMRYPADYRQGEHWHMHPTITLVVCGALEERAGTATHRADVSSVVVKPAGTAHSDMFGSGGARTLQIAWTGLPTQRERTWTSAFADYRWNDGGPSAAAIVRLYRLLEGIDAAPDLALEETLCELAALSMPRQAERRGAARPAWLARVVEQLVSSGPEGVRISDLAADAKVHPVYLARVFRRFHRCSMSRFVRRQRVADVCRRLATSRTPLATLAQEAGFADQPHLCRAFRAEMGLTPSAYRDLVRSN